MRVTLDIADDVLKAAREIAKAEHKKLGKVISALVRRELLLAGTTQSSGADSNYTPMPNSDAASALE